jgi:hypothetical protein
MPFGSNTPDPDSEVVVLFSLEAMRLVCLQCDLNQGETTETSTAAAMSQHLDAHRASGDRVPNSYYEDLEKWRRDQEHEARIQQTYAWPGRAQDGGLFIFLALPGNPLYCNDCELNNGRSVEFYSTEDLLVHLDTHRDEGFTLPAHILECLRRDQEHIDDGIGKWLDERGVTTRPAPMRQPANLWEPFAPMPERAEAFDQLTAMAHTAIKCLEEPLSPAERSIGWSEECIETAVVGVRSLLEDVERVKSGEVPESGGADPYRTLVLVGDGEGGLVGTPISHNGPERQLVSDIFTVTDGIGSALGFYARSDPRLHVCDEIKSFIFRIFDDPFGDDPS